MAVDVASFKARFPEFVNAGDALIAAVITEAELEVPAKVWRAKTDAGVLWLAAHKLATSPSGEAARLANGSSMYLAEFDRLRTQVAYFGPRVT